MRNWLICNWKFIDYLSYNLYYVKQVVAENQLVTSQSASFLRRFVLVIPSFQS